MTLGDTEEELQSILDIVYNWCLKWGVKVNLSKTKTIHFRIKRKSQSSFSFKLGDQKIEYTHEYKYLGYYINEFLDIEESLKKVYESASRAAGVLIAKAKAHGGFPLDIFTRIFNATVLPVIDFSAHIWAHRDRPLLNKIQYSALRFFFGLGKAAPIAALIGDSGWVPLQMSLQFVSIKYWFRIYNLPCDRLPNKAYLWGCEIADCGKKNWVFYIRNLLNSIDMQYSFPDTCNPRETLDHIWDALADKFLKAWQNDVWNDEALRSESGGKLVIYRTLKQAPQSEPYARAKLSVGVRRVLAGLRAGCLPLQVEVGRYAYPKVPFNERLCKLCGEGIEDQTHLLLQCRELRNARSAFFRTISETNDDFLSYSVEDKMKYLLQPQDNIYALSHAIYKMYAERQSQLLYLY